LTATVGNVLGTPVVAATSGGGYAGVRSPAVMPWTALAGGLVLLVVALVGLAVGVVLLCWRSWRAGRLAATRRLVDATYPAKRSEGGTESARCAVTRTWATSALTDQLARTLAAGGVLTFVVLAGTAGYEYAAAHGHHVGFIDSAAQFGATGAAFFVLWLLRRVQRSLTDPAARKRIAFFWDVLTFWPRAVHPLGPPSYAERSIPELVDRIRTVVGDPTLLTPVEGTGLPGPAAALLFTEEGVDSPVTRPFAVGEASCLVEPQRAVLLTGYSQGSPMSVATVAQLPRHIRDRVALMTLAAPVRRLYGRAFPAYFGRDQLESLADILTDVDGTVRWHNLVRESDYIGGKAFGDSRPPQQEATESGDGRTPHGPYRGIDSWIYDPPALWLDGPLEVPIHLHSDWFVDPQTYPYADDLAQRLMARNPYPGLATAPPRPRGPLPNHRAGGAVGS
jgi:hypothetical protein